MKNEASLRWGAWFGDGDLPLKFPIQWKVETFKPSGEKSMGEKELRMALKKPFESPTLKELAKGRRDAVIVVDDLTRPTPAHRLLPLIIEELVAGGIDQEKIRIIMGVAAHHPMLRGAIIRKIGKIIADSFTVMNHNVFENCEYLGKSTAGTPIYINRNFLRADVKVCVGSILPHGSAGFGGGAKLVMPGVAGIETIYQNHRPDNGYMHYTRGLNKVEGNIVRSDMEEAAEMAGLDFIVNTVINPKREIVGLFCGHYIAAHRKGVQLARKVYATPAPREYDIAIVSAYPKDTEFYQYGGAYHVINSTQHPVLRSNGTIVVCSAATEGVGEHFLGGPGFRLSWQTVRRRPSMSNASLYYSRNVSPYDLEHWGIDGGALCRSWREIIARLHERHGKHARIAVFPCAAMQLATTL